MPGDTNVFSISKKKTKHMNLVFILTDFKYLIPSTLASSQTCNADIAKTVKTEHAIREANYPGHARYGSPGAGTIKLTSPY